jgi:hypothetical protein
MDLRREVPGEVSRIAADFSTAALALVHFRLLPLGVVADIFASGLALRVFENLTKEKSKKKKKKTLSANGQAVDIDKERVCKFLIFSPLCTAFKERLVASTSETSAALHQEAESPKRRRADAKVSRK